MRTHPRILVIVVTYQGMEWLPRCLGSVAEASRSDYFGALDLFVVDNGSTDGSPDYVAAAFPAARLVRSRENLGFGAANNIGLQAALEGDYDAAYLMNQDAWLLPGTLEALVRAAAADPSWGILSPRQLAADGVTPDRQFARRTASLPDGTGSVPFIMAAHWLLPQVTIRKVGLFAPLFDHNGEDDNYCDRVRYHGLKVGVFPFPAIHDRADRPESKETRLRRSCYAGSLARLCDINRPLWEGWLYVLGLTAVKSVRCLSLLPWRYWVQVMGRLPAVRQMRRETR